ncbi:MAG TPA: hypothetical protein VNV88_10870 [Candidatus Solibacter sp.]|nr:hypothetical protein [Candidatus Solibacter sp.]
MSAPACARVLCKVQPADREKPIVRLRLLMLVIYTGLQVPKQTLAWSHLETWMVRGQPQGKASGIWE